MDILYVVYIVSTWIMAPKVTLWAVPNGAMLPEVREGDFVLIGKNEEICVGDIVVYSVDKEEICRRVSQEIKDGWITKSDVIDTNDTFILTRENYKGTVRMIWHNGVLWDKRIRSTGTVMTLLAVTAFVMLFW